MQNSLIFQSIDIQTVHEKNVDPQYFLVHSLGVKGLLGEKHNAEYFSITYMEKVSFLYKNKAIHEYIKIVLFLGVY